MQGKSHPAPDSASTMLGQLGRLHARLDRLDADQVRQAACLVAMDANIARVEGLVERLVGTTEQLAEGVARLTPPTGASPAPRPALRLVR